MGIPEQRKPGQRGGRGGLGRNMHNAQKRDQAPYERKFPRGPLTLIVVLAIVVVVGALIL